jgi:hypothetical protein
MKYSFVSIGCPTSPLNPAANGGADLLKFVRDVSNASLGIKPGFTQLDLLPGDVPDDVLDQIRALGITDFSGVCFAGKHWDAPADREENIQGLHTQWDGIAKYGTIAAGPLFRGFGVGIAEPDLGDDQRFLINPVADGIAEAILSYEGTGIQWVLSEMINRRENHGFNDLPSCLEVCALVRKKIAGKTKIKFGFLPDICHIEDYRRRVCPGTKIEDVLAPLETEFNCEMPPVVHFSACWSRGEFTDDPTPMEAWARFLVEQGFDGTVAIEFLANHPDLRGLIPGFGIKTYEDGEVGAAHARALKRVVDAFTPEDEEQ